MMREKLQTKRAKKVLLFLLLTCLLGSFCACGGAGKDIKIDPSVDSGEASGYETTLAREAVDSFQSCFYGGESEIYYALDEELLAFLDSQPDCNTMTIFLSWSALEFQRGVYDFSEYQRVFDLITSHGYKLIVVIDTTGRPMYLDGAQLPYTSIPFWVWDAYPEDQSVDFYGNLRPGFDYYATEHIPEVLKYYETCLDWLDTNYKDSVYAVTPGFQTENEIKFAQKEYCWESYSDEATTAFQAYLEEKYGTIRKMNKAHPTEWKSFDTVEVPVIAYNNTVLGPNLDESPLYTDFMDFRENAIVSYAKNFTDVIHAHDYKTLGYFGQFMYPVDAIYATGVARKCSGLFDYAVIDYNFFDGYQVLYDSLVSAYMTNMMSNLGYEKVFTGLYFERINLTGHEDFVAELGQNILRDGHSDGYEIGSLVLMNGDAADQYRFANPDSKNCERARVAIYNSEWNYYKTHGEDASLMNYLNDSAVYLYDILQNRLGIPVEVITDQCVLSGGLADFDLVFFPAQIYMADAELEYIRAYLEQGGKIIQDYRFGDYNEYALETKDREVFGIRSQNAQEEATVIRALGEGWPETLQLQKLYDRLPVSYAYTWTEGSALYQGENEGKPTNVCMVSGNTMTWGFQPQLQYKASGDVDFCTFIYNSILFMEKLDTHILE